MKLCNNLIAVADSTTAKSFAALFTAVSGYAANLVRNNKSNNKYVQTENLSLNKCLTNKQSARKVTPFIYIEAGGSVSIGSLTAKSDNC